MKLQKKYSIEDLSHVGEVRRSINTIAEDMGFNETRCGKISIVVSELATNLIKHAARGEILAIVDEHSLSVLSLDSGPGMGDVSRCFEDGFSTQGTAGNGLGAMKRLSSRFDFFTSPVKGTAIFVAFDVDEKRVQPKITCSGFSLPMKGETVSGDNWTCAHPQIEDETFKIMMADGLGHGLMAHEASRAAVVSFDESSHLSSLQDVHNLHQALRSTRGAAVAVCYLDTHKHVVEFCGLGNIAGSIVTRSAMKKLISYNGTAGHQLRKTQALAYPMEVEDLLILHSDGLSTHWNLSDYPGLFLKEPLIIAGILYRDFTRGTDDVSVVVVRENP